MAESMVTMVSKETSRLLNLPNSLIKNELEGLYGSAVLEDMKDIMGLYDIYEQGAEYHLDSTSDYVPADLRYKTSRALLDKEVRFLFSKTPDFYVDPVTLATSAESEKAKNNITIYQDLINAVLEKNNFPLSLLKAAKDCFIGKRVALMFNINEDTGIQISFLPSLEFVYDVDPSDSNKLTKLVAFYNLNDVKSKSEQRIYKKKYWLENNVCHYLEEIYDGMGVLVETVTPDTVTRFDFIPARVITNDGLTGDLMGESEIDYLSEYESWYSRLASADMDAERKGMNPIRYSIDASPESTKGLSISAGAFWDIASDQNSAIDRPAQVGVLDSPMSYSGALQTTLNRVKNAAYEQVAVPNVSPEALQGVVSSGKTLKAIYWDLIVRCDEKMLAWRPALQFIAKCIIEGVRLYPKAGQFYIQDSLPDEEYTIRVDNQYSLPEDEAEEKQIDLAEVTAQTMSRRSYMKKWRNLTDEEAEDELRQIAREREMLEDAFEMPRGGTGTPTDNSGEIRTAGQARKDEETEESTTEKKETEGGES